MSGVLALRGTIERQFGLIDALSGVLWASVESGDEALLQEARDFLGDYAAGISLGSGEFVTRGLAAWERIRELFGG